MGESDQGSREQSIGSDRSGRLPQEQPFNLGKSYQQFQEQSSSPSGSNQELRERLPSSSESDQVSLKSQRGRLSRRGKARVLDVSDHESAPVLSHTVNKGQASIPKQTVPAGVSPLLETLPSRQPGKHTTPGTSPPASPEQGSESEDTNGYNSPRYRGYLDYSQMGSMSVDLSQTKKQPQLDERSPAPNLRPIGSMTDPTGALEKRSRMVSNPARKGRF